MGRGNKRSAAQSDLLPHEQLTSGNQGRGIQDATAWLASYSKVSKHMARLGDIERRLNKAGGILRIPDVLPVHVADAVLSMLQNTPHKRWNSTAAQEDYTHNNISHEFYSTKTAAGMDAVVRVLSLLLPNRLYSFSAARYDRSHHIAPHDDRAYTEVSMEDGSVITCSRDIAVIYYLTKDWRPEWGGALVDLESGKTYIPQYNSLVVFRVPRYHQVTPLLTDHPRYSIFGWFLEEGIKYELFKGEEGPGARCSGTVSSATAPCTVVVAGAAAAEADKDEEAPDTENLERTAGAEPALCSNTATQTVAAVQAAARAGALGHKKERPRRKQHRQEQQRRQQKAMLLGAAVKQSLTTNEASPSALTDALGGDDAGNARGSKVNEPAPDFDTSGHPSSCPVVLQPADEMHVVDLPGLATRSAATAVTRVALKLQCKHGARTRGRLGLQTAGVTDRAKVGKRYKKLLNKAGLTAS